MKKTPKSTGKLTVLENSEPIVTETEQVQSRIRQRAFELSQARGHAGREVDDWLSAEAEIVSVPPLELCEKEGAFVVQLAVAGIRAEDLQVLATTDQILLKGEFRHEHPQDAGTIHQCEFKSATIFRNIRFPEAIDLKGLRVECEDGIFRITARKAGDVAAKKPSRRATKPRITSKAKAS